MEKATVVWSGSYSIDSVKQKFNSYKDFGIYLFTRLWGDSETLLYIGRVYGIEYWRCFADRLPEHNWLSDLRGNIRVRIGRVRLSGSRKQSLERMKDIESLLIYAHQPIENVQSTSWYYGRELKIKNIGRKGPLKSEICSKDCT